jgi:acyl carrier protein
MSMPEAENPDDTMAVLRQLVGEARETSEQPPLDLTIEADEPLSAYLDSMALASLILLVEDHWGIELEDDDIDPANFATLRTLAAFLETR